MPSRRSLAASITAIILLAAVSAPGKSKLADEAARFDKLVDDYYREWIVVHPTDATELGLHEHDAQLEDVSAPAVAREAARLKSWQARFATVRADKLPAARAIDLAVLQRSIESQILERDKVRRWRKHPSRYVRLASHSVYVLIKRDFAPLAERMKSAISREEKIPALLAAARANLIPAEVPRTSVDIALRGLPGTIGFYERDVPLAFAEVKDAALQEQFKKANAAVVAALRDYQRYLEKDLLPKASGQFALGEALFREKLRADEMIEAPLDALLARGEGELKKLQEEFRATARRIDPKRTFAEVQKDIMKDHPAPDRAIPETQARLEGLRRFLRDKQIVTVPSEVLPRVQETPPFRRATTFASMETPGPFEARATEAYYNETLPEPDWPKERIEEFMEGYSRPLIDIVAIHEAFPGHYVQFLWLPRVASKVRKFEDAGANSEGWAHYCEQMMLDEGWGGGDPKLKLAQLQDALLRAARYVAAIRMHARGMTYEEAVTFFQKEGLQTKEIAEMESRRGTEDPTFLVYTWGKLEILAMRDEYRKKQGADFTLGKFHDALLAEGAIPIPLLRKALLGN